VRNVWVVVRWDRSTRLDYNSRTWHDPRLGRHHQLDHFLTDGRLSERIYDTKRFIKGAESDHLRIKLNLRFGHKHSPRKPSKKKNLKVDWQQILEDPTTAGLFYR
jgi:hypothetical protein